MEDLYRPSQKNRALLSPHVQSPLHLLPRKHAYGKIDLWVSAHQVPIAIGCS